MRLRMFIPSFGAVLMAMLAVGCASSRPSTLAVPSSPLGSELPRYEADEPPAEPEEPQGELTLQRALGLALLHNPDLAVFSWEIRAREAEAIQAGLLPNPEFMAEVENFAGSGVSSGFGTTETTLSLSQLIELGGKRSKRLSVANLERDLAAWDYEAKRIDVLTTTTRAFIAVLAAQEQLSLAKELTKVADNILRSVARRVEAGATSPVEENRARVSLETSRIDRERRERALTVALSQLAAQWGSGDPQFSAVRGDLDRLLAPPELTTLDSKLQQAPAIARWATEITRRRVETELARSQRIPDLDIGLGLRRFSETQDLGAVFAVSLPIPLFDRNQGEIRAAQTRVVQAEHAQRSVETAILAQLQAAHAEAAASFDEVLALRSRAIPEAESAFNLTEVAYSRGRMRLTDVFDTERTLFELRARLVDAQLRYHSAVADLERLTGTPLSTMSNDPRTP